MSNIYVGIDIGTKVIGWCLLDDNSYLKSGSIAFAGELEERYVHACEWLDIFFEDLILKDNLYVVGIEYPHYNKYKGNIQTTIKLSIIWGFVMSSACRFGAAQVEKIQPSSAKKCLTGHGNADKESVNAYAEMVAGRDIDQLDESDAIAVAWATRSIYGLTSRA